MKLEPLEILKTIGVTEVTTGRQRANGTRMFLYPQKKMYNSGHTEPIRFAIYKSGYVRRVTNGHAANYYINTRFKSKHDKPAIGRSLLMSPFNKFFTWQTTIITEIVEKRDDYIKFKTENSTYKLLKLLR